MIRTGDSIANPVAGETVTFQRSSPSTKDSLMTNQEHENTTTRRGLLGAATVGLGATIGGVIATPVAAYMLAPATQQTTFRPAPLGPVSSFTAETGFAPTPAPYVDHPAQPPGASR